MHGLRVTLVAAMACALTGACKRTPSPSEPHQEIDAEVNVAQLLAAANLSRELVSRGGARVEAQTNFHVTPAAGAGEAANMKGDQNVATNTQLVVNGRGHYLLKEENDQDGGREVIFAGDQIGVKLRYGKLIRRSARAPEPQHMLEQAVGGPAAFWEIFGSSARLAQGAADVSGARVIRLSLGQTETSPEPRVPLTAEESPLTAWRRTAVPSSLEGEIHYLQATTDKPAVLVSASLSGSFTARTAKAPITGELKVTWKASSWGDVPPIALPEEAEDLRVRQRTILEERALLQGLPTAAPSPPRQ